MPQSINSIRTRSLRLSMGMVEVVKVKACKTNNLFSFDSLKTITPIEGFLQATLKISSGSALDSSFLEGEPSYKDHFGIVKNMDC